MKPLFFSTLKGIAVFIPFAALLLFALALAAMRLDEPKEFIFIFSNAALFISAFLSGRLSASGDKRLLSGLITGSSLTVIILLISLILSSFDGGSFIRMALTVLTTVLGALSRKSGKGAPRTAKKRKSIQKKYSAYR